MTTELEAEREFLLRSLDDLEAERDAGNIDPDTYRTLHDDYTARAAAVIRAIDTDTEPAVPKRAAAPRGLQIATGVVVVAFAVAAVFWLGQAVGTRGANQTATGNSQVAEDPTETLAQVASENPDDYDARISYARALLGQDRVAALKEYDAAAALDPTQAEPVTYSGWIIGLAARNAEPGPDRDLLVKRALERLNAAVDLDPGYQDSYVFRGIIEFEVVGDAPAAADDFSKFLTLAPADHPMRGTVESSLARAIEATESTDTTSTTGGP